jgi:two-component system phosphate regulon sensor histidine kinase PhoR
LEKTTIRALARFSTLVLVAVAVGLLQGDVELYLLLALCGYLLWHLWNLYRFEAWIKAGARADAPDLPAIWGELVSYIIRLKQRSRTRKRRYKLLIKEFRKSSAALPDGTVVLDANNTILWFNQAAGRMLGLKKASDRGQQIMNLIRRPEFVEFVESDQPEGRLTFAAPHKPGHYYSLELVPYGLQQRMLLVRDITREVRVESMRRDFVANASHELRSPLTVLSGYLDAMADDQSLAGEWSEPLKEMRTQADRMTGIVDDMLTLSRLEAEENAALETREIDVPLLLEAIRAEVMARPGVGVNVELELLSDAHLLGVEPDLRSAFNNLVENAIKYTPPGGRVVMRWEAGEDGASMSVADTGMGVEAAEIPRLTERFYRVDKGRGREQGGIGLGLAIVKHVLQRHQAELEIQSQPGKGSTFTCRFTADQLVKKQG